LSRAAATKSWNQPIKLTVACGAHSLSAMLSPLYLPLDYSSLKSTETGNEAAANFQEAPEGVFASADAEPGPGDADVLHFGGIDALEAPFQMGRLRKSESR
jgi:hypothetical protein